MHWVRLAVTALAAVAPSTTPAASSSLGQSDSLVPPTPLEPAGSLLSAHTWPQLQAFQNQSVPLVCLPHAVPPSHIQAWRQDAQALQALSFGGTAGVVQDDGTAIRSGVHQVWLASPGRASPPPLLVGNLAARRQLVNTIQALRHGLEAPRSLPPDLVELSYLLYEGNQGGKYGRHVDRRHRSSYHQRSVSFLLYLGSGDAAGDEVEEDPWDCARDGGALRIHGPAAYATGQPVTLSLSGDPQVYADVTPQAGTLVVFDSATVPHEVLVTQRSRICVVGWCGTPVEEEEEETSAPE
jgi:predicted 2-oxoglutarate/Fe(II)-dependent dioxygenase YbiX